MKRSEVIKALESFSLPIGYDETAESRNDKIDAWQNTLDIDTLDILIDLIISPPSKEEMDFHEYKGQEYIDKDIFEAVFVTEILEAIAVVGRKDIQKLLTKLRPLIELKYLTNDIITIIGWTQKTEGLKFFEQLIDNEALFDDEIVELIDAVSKIGGKEALEVLEKIREQYFYKSSKVLLNIENGINLLIDKTKE